MFKSIRYITADQFQNLVNWSKANGFSSIETMWYGQELWYNKTRNDMFVGNGAKKLGGISKDGRCWVQPGYHKISIGG